MYPTMIFERWAEGGWVQTGRSGTPERERKLMAEHARLEAQGVFVRRLRPSIYEGSPPTIAYQTGDRALADAVTSGE
jgi:hypothetical protein